MTELQDLRDQVARLLGRNLELAQKVEELERERVEVGVDDIARSVAGAARSAEQAMADEAAGGLRFTVPRVEVAVRGLVSVRENRVALRFPGVEERVGDDRLSSVSMVVAHVPMIAGGDDLVRLAEALARAQAAAAAWEPDRGREAAADIAARATHLLALQPGWGDAETVAGIASLADAFARLGEATGPVLPPDATRRYVAASKALSELAERLEAAGRASPDEFGSLAAPIGDLVTALAMERPR